MTDIIKSGTLLKYSSSAFNSKWKYNYIELCRNSTFRWYDKQGDSSPKRSIFLKDVSAFLAFGDIVKQLPFKPEMKAEEFELVIAVPHENNRNTRLSFFKCNNAGEIQEWVNAILNSVTDKPPEQATSYSGTNNPPPTNYGPPPNYSAPSSSGPPYGSQQPYYPGSGNPSGPPAIGFNIGNSPAGPYSGGNGPPGVYPGGNGPPGAYPAGNGPPGAYPHGNAPPVAYPGGNAPAGAYPRGNAPPGAYPQPYQQPNNSAYPYSGAPQIHSQPNYQPVQGSAINYPRQPGYVPGAPQVYAAGASYGQPVSYVTGQPSQTYVVVDGKKKKHSKIKNAAIGVAAGAATAYAASKIFGHHHGWGHGYGHGYGHDWGHGWGGHYGMGWHNSGSWSSLSSGSWSD